MYILYSLLIKNIALCNPFCSMQFYNEKEKEELFQTIRNLRQ